MKGWCVGWSITFAYFLHVFVVLEVRAQRLRIAAAPLHRAWNHALILENKPKDEMETVPRFFGEKQTEGGQRRRQADS